MPGLRKFPGEGNGNSLRYSYLENSMDRGAWRATVSRVAKGLKQLVTHACTLLVEGRGSSWAPGLWRMNLFTLRAHSGPYSTPWNYQGAKSEQKQNEA